MSTNTHCVLEALQSVTADPAHSQQQIPRWFSPDYQQQVDGNRLNYEQFIAHMATLKTITRSMTLHVDAIAANGNSVLTHHRVGVIKQNGESSQIEVFAHFQLREGRIIRCDELTRLLAGDPADAALGQRIE